ncbi:MAG: hypothetical protein CMK09_18865 [Ponticaulis sp.]|nr:hypothetical protein [Ponticaulis sp.]|tara:strand:+ start:146503 stop:147270 length:768 start_codon:yes stop_codon:yes gene_type:complete
MLTQMLRSALLATALIGASAATAPAFAQVTGVPTGIEQTWTDHSWTAPDGTVFHYVEQGEGTPVILIHGFTSSAIGNWFRPGVAQKIATTNRVIALDMRGHGDTGPSPEDSDGTMIQDVVDFMDHLRIDKAHIAGYSMGGATTAGLMREAPERFITAGPLGIGIRKADEEPAATPARAPKGAPNPSQDVDLTQIDFPVIAINGSDDRPIPKTERMWRELKNFQMVVIPGRHHMNAVSHPGFGEALHKFIVSHNPK